MTERKLIAFEDPDHKGNQPEYHTGKPCIEPECDRPAGTAWSALWCFECNLERIRRINKQLTAIAADLGIQRDA